ncbi:MAG: tyrosine-type recombinase/integrase [Planctomycetes bacterium]|nr:tyrosine-type recombinase/integrase [Planctomycetota bacterium]
MSPSIDDVMSAYQGHLLACGRSHRTIELHSRYIRLCHTWIVCQLYQRSLLFAQQEDIAAFVVSRTVPGRANCASTLNVIRSVLRSFFAYVHRRGWMEQNPTQHLERARHTPIPRRGLTEREVERLRSSLATAHGETARRDEALIELLLRTGIRIGSALALDVSDLDLESGEIVVRQAKGNRAQRVCLPPTLAGLLRMHLRGRSRGALFEGASGRRLGVRHAQRRIRHWFTVALGAQAATAHTFRRTFATQLYRATRDVLLVKEALGHAQVQSTLAYTSATREEVYAAVRRLDLFSPRSRRSAGRFDTRATAVHRR